MAEGSRGYRVFWYNWCSSVCGCSKLQWCWPLIHQLYSYQVSQCRITCIELVDNHRLLMGGCWALLVDLKCGFCAWWLCYVQVIPLSQSWANYMHPSCLVQVPQAIKKTYLHIWCRYCDGFMHVCWRNFTRIHSLVPCKIKSIIWDEGLITGC